MTVKIIKSEGAYQLAIARLSALMDTDILPDSALEEELELLALVIQKYEHSIVPPPALDPLEAILFRLDQMGLSRKDLIPYIGSAPRVSEVLSRKRPLTLSMIRRLHQGLGIPAEALIGIAQTPTSRVS